MQNNWFCDDHDGEGLTWHATEAQALARAAACIAHWRDDGEDWPEEVESVCVGMVTHRAQQTNITRPALPLDADGDDQQGVHWESDEDYRCEYGMQTEKCCS
jgi:hypothetical protein